MEQKHQDLIKANYSTLVRNMIPVSVAGHLYALHIITDEMRQQIEAEMTNYDKNRKLLSIILRRGSRAFMGLRKALMKANQGDLSRLLMNNDEDTKSEYEKKLAMARSFVINTKENGTSESKKRPVISRAKMQNTFGRRERPFPHCHAIQRNNLNSYTSPCRVSRPPYCHQERGYFSFGPMVEI